MNAESTGIRHAWALLEIGVVVFIDYALVSTAYMMNEGGTSAAVRDFVKRDVRQIADTVMKLEKEA
jgi:hypothetical protein